MSDTIENALALPWRIETVDEYIAFREAGIASTYLIQLDGSFGPALVWENEDGDWFGTRPVTENDGPWAEISAASRSTLAVAVTNLPSLDDDPDDYTPFTVLWHDGLGARSDAARLRAGIEALADEWEREAQRLRANGEAPDWWLFIAERSRRLRAILSDSAGGASRVAPSVSVADVEEAFSKTRLDLDDAAEILANLGIEVQPALLPTDDETAGA